MKKAALFLAPLVAASMMAAPAQAAGHSILVGMTAAQVEDANSRCGDDAAIRTTVKLRKKHIASFLAVDLYIGKTWKGSRTHDVDVDGKTKVSFLTCVPYKMLFSPKTGAYYNTKIMVTTMPRSRDSRTATIKQFDDC
ncbi:hypothetical protein JIG36_34250 [Actinoplanes sp. LDG1-06]|uniref:Uncharacterized protein n=1 Tax=Paractinoplanes ovalisporus TaxID=2810368 RepID=A0ABS2AL62_9ACTN|nr:hypothetical protein [Actinoplanes ovalisporus]MBM2620576.1 hypothetical protein [Actinoplanes ovalisporus]